MVIFTIIQSMKHNSKISLDTALAIVLSSMFGLGMYLKAIFKVIQDLENRCNQE